MIHASIPGDDSETKPNRRYRLQFVSGADPSETAWIPAMRSVIDQRIADEQPPRPVGNADQRTDYQQQQQQQQYVSSEQQATITEQQKQEVVVVLSLYLAVDWHAEHQEPLLMAHVEESIPSDMSSKSTTNQISNEAKPRMSPAGGAVARVGGGEHHQHHILHQRRTSTNATPASTAGQSQMAFPPSMPPTGNVHSSHHQTASMRDQQQSANAPHQNTATSAQAHANAMSNMMPSNEAMGQPPQLYTAETGRDSSYMAAKGGGGQQQQTHAMFWQGEEANIRTASRDGREEDSSESHFTVVPSDTTSASSAMTNQQLNMMGGGYDGTQMGMTANSRSQDQVEEDQMTDAGFTGITTTMTATRTSNSSTSVNESTYRKHSGTNDASGTPTTTAGMVSPYSQMNDSVFTPTVVSKQPQTAPSAARMPPQPPSVNAPQMPQMGQAQASSSSENDVRSGQMNSSAAANAGGANGAHQQNHQSSGGGIFSILKAKIVKAIPTGHEMILPDDKNPSIVWDPVLNKYVGAGVEEEPINTPPPSTANSGLFESMSTHGSSGGLRAARVSGGELIFLLIVIRSRYFNPLNDASSSSAQTLSQSPVPVMQMPVPTTSFGFIPSMPGE
ncbi:unnamed protein product [Anisakis simplex]|uniref:Uncharacterized protein n=1 Tax=Anisakis simplex TaxID=6269 RepID=A0A3P6RFE7_ANISI|nr:unnamed protein product [Anisakis simplex]